MQRGTREEKARLVSKAETWQPRLIHIGQGGMDTGEGPAWTSGVL